MINKFLNYLQLERNYSQRTVESYGEDLTAFESYFKNLSAELTWESVDSFYRFALSRHLVKRDPSHMIKGPKKEKPLPKFIREADIDRLLEPEMWKDTYDDLLARTIILVLYTTGLRLSELVGLDDEMVDFVNSQLKVTGKRNKQRIIPFGNELAEELRKYIAARDEKVVRVTPGLLLTEKGKRISPIKVRDIVINKLGLVTTQKKRSPHVLRHSFATAMLNHEAGLESVKKLLGHESLATTEIYTHTTFEQLKAVYEKTHPRG